MRGVFVAVALALLCAFVSAQLNYTLPEFVPCSFSVLLSSKIFNPDGEVVATSTDRLIRDNSLDVWRWESDFSGMEPVDPQHWIFIWRPDLGKTFQDYGERCYTNDGCDGQMCPLPYDAICDKNGGSIVWWRESSSWDGMPAYNFFTDIEVLEFEARMTINVHVLEDGTLVLINGTAKSDKYGLDLTYVMEVESYEHNQEFRPTYFIPSPHCLKTGEVIEAPAEAPVDFQKKCYGYESLASRVVLSWALVLVLLMALILF